MLFMSFGLNPKIHSDSKFDEAIKRETPSLSLDGRGPG
jgi:hypothetical protein